MGCTSSKPSNPVPPIKGQKNPDPTRPLRTKARPLHPSAHNPDSLPHAPGIYSSHGAHPARTSKSKGGSKGWAVEGERLKTNAKHTQTKKVDQWLKYQYPPCPGPPPCHPIPAIPRKPVPSLSARPTMSSSQGKKQDNREGQPTTILWQARDQSRFPPAPGPPPNRPIPLLPIAKTQTSKGSGQMHQQKPVSQYPARTYFVFPPRSGPPPSGPPPQRPMVSATAREKRREVVSGVSSLGPEPERLFPHIARARKPDNNQWPPLSDIGRSNRR